MQLKKKNIKYYRTIVGSELARAPMRAFPVVALAAAQFLELAAVPLRVDNGRQR